MRRFIFFNDSSADIQVVAIAAVAMVAVAMVIVAVN